ncbi:MAG: PA14 domain-containing protein [Pirellulales bacterium]
MALSGAGLTAQYFHNSDFTGLAETRVENISHNWGTGAPAAGVAADSFSVRWTGQIEPAFSETYTFNVLSDEGVRLWVNGQLVIDDWTGHVRRNRQGTSALAAGQRYDIRLDYFEGTGAAQIELSWSSASQASQIVPASALYESPPGLWGAYGDTAGHAVSRVDANVAFDWGAAAPVAGINADSFTATWSGQIRADYSEQYTFSTISDERVRLWIGEELIIDDWAPHSSSERLGTKLLEAGKWYDVRLEYQDDTGAANISLRWSSERQTGVGLFEDVPTASLRAAKETPLTFRNPLGAGADPFVVRENGYYYLTMTTNGTSVSVTRAPTLQDVHPNTAVSDTLVVWNAPAGTMFSSQVWAPELHHIGSSWYIYVAASDGDNANHRMYVLERDDPDPFGPFYFRERLAATTDRWAIDGTVFQWQGVLYFVWSGWPGTTDGQQNLYIAEMRNPWTLRGERALISTPQYSWEKFGLPINEGPEVLIENGQLHIIYSASGYWTNEYSLGRLTYNGTGSLLSAASWTKASQPVFTATSLVTGVGHASFTKSPDGTENWIVYHAHANPTVFKEDRVVSIQPFTFAANGTPIFGAPLPPTQVIAAPAGMPQANRVAAVGDFNADGVIDASDYSTWRATFGAALFPGTSAEGNGNGEVDAADYVLWRKRNSQVGAAAVVAGEPNANAAQAVSGGEDLPAGAAVSSTEISIVATAVLDVSSSAPQAVPLVPFIDGKRAPVVEASRLQRVRAEQAFDAAFASLNSINFYEPKRRSEHWQSERTIVDEWRRSLIGDGPLKPADSGDLVSERIFDTVPQLLFEAAGVRTD